MKLPTLGDDSNTRLSQIPTQWNMLAQAQGDSQTGASAAWRVLMHRYCGAAYRYLAGAVRDEDVALELFQEFAVRFLQGDFRRADPVKGRFRDYVRTALMHLVTDHYRRIQNWPRPLPADLIDSAVVPPDVAACEDEFITSWRDELIDRTWRALAESQPSYHAILMMHVRHPGILTRELASRLSEEFDRPISAANARVMLHRARQRFAELLVQEVQFSLECPDREALDQELRALGLWSICKPVMTTPGEEKERQVVEQV
jgi:DNA-directed RNA polymerase specialized sigma24 family protein